MDRLEHWPYLTHFRQYIESFSIKYQNHQNKSISDSLQSNMVIAALLLNLLAKGTITIKLKSSVAWLQMLKATHV